MDVAYTIQCDAEANPLGRTRGANNFTGHVLSGWAGGEGFVVVWCALNGVGLQAWVH